MAPAVGYGLRKQNRSVVGDPAWMFRALRLVRSEAEVRPVRDPGEAEPSAALVPCLQATTADLSGVEPARVSFIDACRIRGSRAV